MDNIYYQSKISRDFLKEFNSFIDLEYNIQKINIKNIILKELENEKKYVSTISSTRDTIDNESIDDFGK
jgi:hypothetical protein|tara:strand:+ start:304 stop:510 length:207 start_codon:yes stop_codon:yes gene_type:complete